MDCKYFGIWGLLGLLFISIPIRAQFKEDSVQYNDLTAVLRSIYFREIRDNAQIYHGSEYIRNGVKVSGFPFYKFDSLIPGTISYQGLNYPPRPVLYDLRSDQLIIQNYSQNMMVVLSPEKVDSFSIQSHVFIQLAINKYNGLVKAGYYDCVLPGDPGVFVRREKRLIVPSSAEEIKWVQYDNYFILYKNTIYAVTGKSDLLNLFKDRKDQLRKYIRSQKLDFKKNTEAALVMITNYYNHLTL
jgi:hypothetical protein